MSPKASDRGDLEAKATENQASVDAVSKASHVEPGNTDDAHRPRRLRIDSTTSRTRNVAPTPANVEYLRDHFGLARITVERRHRRTGPDDGEATGTSSCSDEEDGAGLFAKQTVTPTRATAAGGYLESLNTRVLHFLLSPGTVDGALRAAQHALALAQLMWQPFNVCHHTSNAGLSKVLGLVAELAARRMRRSASCDAFEPPRNHWLRRPSSLALNQMAIEAEREAEAQLGNQR